MHAFSQDVPIGEDLYRKIAENLGAEPMEGLIVHLVVRRPDGLLRYIDVWESQEACDAVFEKRIHPAVFAAFKEAKFRPAGEPARDTLDIVEVRLGSAADRGRIAR
jgi:hypothetical protein